MSRRTWTCAELRDAARRFSEGETWKSIGESYGADGECVRQLVTRHGYKITRRVKKSRPTDELGMLILKAISIRNTEGLSWPLIAEKVQWDKHPLYLRSLCSRWCKENGGSMKTGYPTRRKSRE